MTSALAGRAASCVQQTLPSLSFLTATAAPAGLTSLQLKYQHRKHSAGTPREVPVDPFISKLQHKTEEEVLQLINKQWPGGKAPASAEDSGQEEGVEDFVNNKATGELGGPKGPEPTRFGDWEKGGRCTDF
ncbi:hypothetical protein WJX72_009341 [[Myrmecia] bisecta]|uniref:Succinate dehydrogenase assembly factor 4, mitochondrial n=1 Tax=[Myrmecia] bisecta TaxID=41462 RepID=A0AAW1PQT0_9CHLO